MKVNVQTINTLGVVFVDEFETGIVFILPDR